MISISAAAAICLLIAIAVFVVAFHLGKEHGTHIGRQDVITSAGLNTLSSLQLHFANSMGKLPVLPNTEVTEKLSILENKRPLATASKGDIVVFQYNTKFVVTRARGDGKTEHIKDVEVLPGLDVESLAHHFAAN